MRVEQAKKFRLGGTLIVILEVVTSVVMIPFLRELELEFEQSLKRTRIEIT